MPSTIRRKPFASMQHINKVDFYNNKANQLQIPDMDMSLLIKLSMIKNEVLYALKTIFRTLHITIR